MWRGPGRGPERIQRKVFPSMARGPIVAPGMPRDPGTDRRRTALCARVAACAALGRDRELAAALRAARRGGVPVRALRETLLQVHLFAGFPRTVNALAVLEGTLG